MPSKPRTGQTGIAWANLARKPLFLRQARLHRRHDSLTVVISAALLSGRVTDGDYRQGRHPPHEGEGRAPEAQPLSHIIRLKGVAIDRQPPAEAPKLGLGQVVGAQWSEFRCLGR